MPLVLDMILQLRRQGCQGFNVRHGLACSSMKDSITESSLAVGPVGHDSRGWPLSPQGLCCMHADRPSELIGCACVVSVPHSLRIISVKMGEPTGLTLLIMSSPFAAISLICIVLALVLTVIEGALPPEVASLHNYFGLAGVAAYMGHLADTHLLRCAFKGTGEGQGQDDDEGTDPFPTQLYRPP